MKGPSDDDIRGNLDQTNGCSSDSVVERGEYDHKNGEPRNGVTLEEAPPEDFSDYMWMANEEEFEQQVMQQLEEEALMEECMLQAYGEASPNFENFNPVPQDPMFVYQPIPQQIPVHIPVTYPHWPSTGGVHGPSNDMLAMNMRNLSLSQTIVEITDSKLNPDAVEFVPRFGVSSPVIPVSSQNIVQTSNT